ncbi:ring finger domain-containing protein [Cryptosporidium canis]|uniref:Ring finger domain-containing protein n=1 Tax=Cryptosporidium canis TaxID=195482 RepID=A0A9D5I0C5_9CRYT|nr:ring finger domain-containing protein [Cryptosporidium canis]
MPEYIRMGDEDTASNRNDTCFICLEDSSQGRLKRCCSQCYALVHGRCWSKWSSSQQIAALRSIMLGEQARETEVCSICRGGSVQIEHSEDDSEEISKVLSGRLAQSFFRIVASRIYGSQYGSFVASTVGHPFSSLGTVLINCIFISLIFIYILYQDGYPDSKSLITISLWVYITLVLQFLTLTGMHRRQVLRELAIQEPSLTDSYEGETQSS